MDKRFLNKVVDQLVRETEIDYDGGRIYTPLSSLHPLSLYPFPPPIFRPFFSKHCKEVYGLNYEETEYVWDEYREIIIDMSPL